MSVGFVLAAEADIPAAREIAAGFGLDLLSTASLDSPDAAVAALASAANVGIILSAAAAHDEDFVALMRRLATALQTAQLIATDADARAAFPFLPQAWPVMSLDDARARANALAARRQQAEAPPPVAVGPPALEPEPARAEEPRSAPAPVDDGIVARELETGAGEVLGGAEESLGDAGQPIEEEPSADAPVDEYERSITLSVPDETAASEAPPVVMAPAPQTPPPGAAPDDDRAPPQPVRRRAEARARPAETAPADATAFAPKKLRRGSPELVRIVIHQPKDLADVIKTARKIDPRTSPAPSGMSIGEVALGASVGVSLEVRGGVCKGELQRRTWAGQPIDFSFTVEPDAEVKQAVFLARVFVDDAQIGVIGFTRQITGATKAQPMGDRMRLKRHKRVFLSYSSKDREVVSAIATAYQMAGVPHFWDRTSLKSGEEWHPRLRREIDRADLFHLCWSKSAAASEWVEKEAEYALTRRRRSNGKRPEITVQMLDGPPWAPHPPHLDAINFDDFVRAAIVGYARGDGGD
jgi:hypothetical protein